MDLSAHLEFDLVAVESGDTLSLLLELAAPDRTISTMRAPATLQVVLDRSGSMAGERLEAAKRGLSSLVERLDPADHFGVVSFDDQVRVEVPSAPLADKDAVRHAIRAIECGGMTNLSAGYVRGIREARRAAGDAGRATLLLVSDGHANQGVADHGRLEQLAAGAHRNGVSTSTIGLGLGYDELLLAALARGGTGSTHFAQDGDDAGAALAEECGHLLDTVAQAVTLTIAPSSGVTGIRLVNDLPVQGIAGGVMVELGDFTAGEPRRLLVELDVPAMPALGLAQVCTLELAYTALPSLVTETITVPVHVNVVPGDEAAGRLPAATVVSEKAFVLAQKAKRRAGEALQRGDFGAADAAYGAAARHVAQGLEAAPAASAPEFVEEQRMIADLRLQAGYDRNSAAKHTAMDAHRKERKRGRRGR